MKAKIHQIYSPDSFGAHEYDPLDIRGNHIFAISELPWH